MYHPVKILLLLAAALSTFWAAMAWTVGVDGDFKVAAVISIVCLGTVQFLEYRDHEEQQQRYRWEQGREDVWGRREWRDDEFLRETD